MTTNEDSIRSPEGDERQIVASKRDPYAEIPLDGRGVGVALEALLKKPGGLLHALREREARQVVGSLALIALLCLCGYGMVVGSLSGGSQLWAAPLKVLAGSLASALICLPSLYVFLCLGGVDARFREVVGSLVAMVALASVMLVGLAPVAWVFSESTDSVALMSVMHLVFWAIATGLGARLLGRFLGRAGSVARLRGWLAIYLLVCVQMMTSLRPIVGRADTVLPTEKRFFLQHFFEMLDGEGRVERSGIDR